jgi:hypothetical protein
MPLMTIAFFPLEFVTPETNYVDSYYRRIFTDGRDLPECTPSWHDLFCEAFPSLDRIADFWRD